MRAVDVRFHNSKPQPESVGVLRRLASCVSVVRRGRTSVCFVCWCRVSASCDTLKRSDSNEQRFDLRLLLHFGRQSVLCEENRIGHWESNRWYTLLIGDHCVATTAHGKTPLFLICSYHFLLCVRFCFSILFSPSRQHFFQSPLVKIAKGRVDEGKHLSSR